LTWSSFGAMQHYILQRTKINLFFIHCSLVFNQLSLPN